MSGLGQENVCVRWNDANLEAQESFLGFLDPSSESEDIAEGTSIELPYWLARSLCSQRRQIVTVEIPKIYKEAYREILKADPCVVDLHKLEIYFYEFGSYLARLDHRDSQPIGAMLVQ
ncbi:unnamed protein product, partial [Timema podura]|nr:unnamed protein product [Timema podura]